MKNMTIRTKIMLAFGTAALLSIANAAVITAVGESGAATVTAWVFAGVTAAFCAVAGVLLSVNISKPLKFFAECFAGIAATGNIFLDDYAYKQTKILNKRGDDIGNISRAAGDLLAMFREKIKWLNAVKDGDLTARVANRSAQDTIGVAMESMVDSLNNMFGEIRGTSLCVSEGAVKLDDGAKFLADVSAEQAEAIGFITMTIHETAEHTLRKAELAVKAAELSANIKALAEKSSHQMSEMTAAVNAIRDSGNAIANVIKVIDDIASQTNLLAINAGVEAARAGQHGKGFAIVAQEVRSLAAKSHDAATETERLIVDSIGKSRAGAEIAAKTAESLNQIVAQVTESVDLARSISELSDSQAKEIAQINLGIDEVNSAVTRSSRAAAESANESREVTRQSERLRQSLLRFRVR